jgi:uncharacterized membrane protein (DUF485 family)
MRALGPGSVSSFLKVILDVVRFVLWVSAIGVSIAILAVLLLSFKPELLGGAIGIDRLHIAGRWLGPLAAAALLGADLYFAGAIIIVGRLRRIFQTLIAGDPFHPDNVRRLRVIGGALAALEVGRYVAAGLLRLFMPDHGAARLTGGVSLTTWFAVLVIVVLAEVFREGARLRGEAELTI